MNDPISTLERDQYNNREDVIMKKALHQVYIKRGQILSHKDEENLLERLYYLAKEIEDIFGVEK